MECFIILGILPSYNRFYQYIKKINTCNHKRFKKYLIITYLLRQIHDMTCIRYDIPMYKIPLWRKRHINWGILFSEKIQISQNELPQCIVVCVCYPDRRHLLDVAKMASFNKHQFGKGGSYLILHLSV